MKSGFTLIEVLIATMMAGIISVILLNGLSIINRGLLRSDQQADLYMRVTTVQNQLERDLMGAFDPMPPARSQKKEGEDKKAEEQKRTKSGKQPAGEEKKEKPKQKKVEKVFLATAADGDNLELLTFVTNNPTKIFWGEKSGRAKPCIARVVYRLVPEKERRDSFRLLRQEADDLDFKAYEERDQRVRAYELADGIKECKLTYIWIEREQAKEKNAKAGQQAKAAETGKAIVHREQSWDADKKVEKDSKRPRIPQRVQIELVAWEGDAGRRELFTLTIPIFFTPYQEVKKEEPGKQPDKKDDKSQKQQQQGPSGQPGGHPGDLPIVGMRVGQVELGQLEGEHVQAA